MSDQIQVIEEQKQMLEEEFVEKYGLLGVLSLIGKYGFDKCIKNEEIHDLTYNLKDWGNFAVRLIKGEDKQNYLAKGIKNLHMYGIIYSQEEITVALLAETRTTEFRLHFVNTINTLFDSNQIKSFA